MAEKILIDTTKPQTISIDTGNILPADGPAIAIPGNREVTDATIPTVTPIALPIAEAVPDPIPAPPTQISPDPVVSAPDESPPPIPTMETQTIEVQPWWQSLGHTFIAALMTGFIAWQAGNIHGTLQVVPKLQTSITQTQAATSQTQVLQDQVKEANQARVAAETKAADLQAQVPQYPTIVTLKKYYFLLKKPDGSYELRTGGSPSWRYNNPGKILYDNFAKSNKAIGQDGTLAIFGSEEDGMAALSAYLFDSDFGYKDKTVEDAIKRFAPTRDGYNQHDYIAYVLAHSKVKTKTVLSSMTADDRTDFLTAIRDYEHWIAGNVTNYANEDEFNKSKGK